MRSLCGGKTVSCGKSRCCVINGQYPQAIEYLEGNYFHAQEGRDEIHDVYVNAHLLQGLRLLKQAQAAAALKQFEKASEYPENLSVGRPKNDPRAPAGGLLHGPRLRSAG